MSVRCFLIEPTGVAVLSLRRYGPGSTCPSPHGYHDASVTTDVTTAEAKRSADGHALAGWDAQDWPDDDPRWPTTCAGCGYAFTDDADVRQAHYSTRFRRSDNGAHVDEPLHKAPVGAMWDAWWVPDSRRGDDGRAMCVMLPDGTVWDIDAEATGGGHWVRTGEPPNLTVTPSIASPGYHGFLTDGVLSDPL